MPSWRDFFWQICGSSKRSGENRSDSCIMVPQTCLQGWTVVVTANAKRDHLGNHNMNRRVFLLAMTLMVLVVTGCSTTGQRWHPALCALAGAAAGGAAGAIANDNTAGAMGAVGGIAGALVCATQDVDGDADGDGVKDSRDDCPGTRRGADVDSRGCEIVTDSDGDGVVDG